MHPFKRIVLIGIIGMVACGPHLSDLLSSSDDHSSHVVSASAKAHKEAAYAAKEAALAAKLQRVALRVKAKLHEADDADNDVEEIDD